MSDTQTRILDLAEKAIRERGYHAVSFRDFADALGIKSASIHYHFRHKEDLGIAVVERYAGRVADSLGPAGALPWPDAVRRFAQVYLDALNRSALQCLCGMLATESQGLPEPLARRVEAFFRSNIDWLTASIPDTVKDKEGLALGVQAELQGAMTVAIGLNDAGILTRVSERLLNRVAAA